MISTRNIHLLPDVVHFQAAFQSMAMLDAIIMPEWEYRYYSFEANLDLGSVTSVGSMRNGSGDDLHALFGPVGCLIRGFAHEYPMSPYADDPPKVFPGVLDDVPVEFSDCLAALHSDWWRDITFCVWRKHADAQWHHGRITFPDHHDPDGSEDLLSVFDGLPETYHSWAEEYYGPTKFNLAIVRHIFEHRPLTEEIVRELNPKRSLAELAEEVRQMGYPSDRI